MEQLRRVMLGVTFVLGLGLSDFGLGVSPVHSATYNFSFLANDTSVTLSGSFEVDPSDQIVSISGTISGTINQTILAIVPPTSPYPAISTSPDGQFWFNNHFNATTYVDFYGLLFSTIENPGGYWNLWVENGLHKLWATVAGQGFAVQIDGRLSVAETPLPGALLLFLTGLGGLICWGRRGRQVAQCSA